MAHHGEGPVWWDGWGGLKFVDMMAGDVLSLQASAEVTRVHVGTVAAALRPRSGGGAVVATERAFALAARDDLSDAVPLPDVWSSTSIRFNDGGCDPQGRFWCGTMAYDEAKGAGTMYRLERRAGEGGSGYRVETMWGDVTISNGFAYSPDGSRAYYNDTPTRQVSVLDVGPDGALANRRPLADLAAEGGPEKSGSPDGLCVDAEGGVWVACWGASQVHRYSAQGGLEAVVELPCSHVTACTFGGDGLRTLYITTSAEGVDRRDEPQAGALFALTPGVAGTATLPFAG